MASINKIGSQSVFTPVSESNNEQVATTNLNPPTQYSTFETPKPSDFLDKALFLPPGANGKRELFTESNVNNFIQSKVKVEDQIGICQNLQPWIKSNFRLHAAQQKTVDNLTQSDLQTTEVAAKRATELNTKLQVKFGATSDEAGNPGDFEKNKLFMEQVNESVYLKFSGCKEH